MFAKNKSLSRIEGLLSRKAQNAFDAISYGRWEAYCVAPYSVKEDPEQFLYHVERAGIDISDSTFFNEAGGWSLNDLTIQKILANPVIKDVERLLSGGGEVWRELWKNVTTNEGREHMLNVFFNNTVSAPSNWYIGLIDGTGSPTTGVTNDSASITVTGGAATNGWNEANTYDSNSGNRPEWYITTQPTASKANPSVITNASYEPSFTTWTGGPFLIEGAFMSTVATNGSTSGVMYAAGTFTEKSLNSDDTLKIQVSFGLTDA